MWRLLCSAAVLAAPALASPERELEREVERYLLAAADDANVEKPWAVSGALGLTITAGNSETTTFSAELLAVKQWVDWRLTLKANSIYAETDGVETAFQHILTERLERRLSEEASIFQDLLLEHDSQEKLNYRLMLTGGYRRRLVDKPDFELWGELGAGVLREVYRTTSDTELIAQAGINFEWQITDELLFVQVLTIYPSLSNGGEFRLVSESTFTTPISERIDARLSIIDRYNSDAPAGVESNDLLITLNLVIRFTDEKP